MLSPTDAAWSVLEEGHRVDKALPFLIPAAMLAYGGYQGAKNVKENRITDPFLGVVGTEGNDSLGSNLAEFGTGFAQGVVPVKGGGFLARKFGGRRAAKRAAAREAAEKEAAEAAARHQALSAQQRRGVLQRENPEVGYVFGEVAPYVSPSQLGAVRQTMNAAQARAARLAPRAQAPVAPLTLGQRAKLVAATGAGAATAYAPEIMMALGLAGSPPTSTEFGGFGATGTGGFGAGQGGQQGFQLAGQQSGGVGGVQNVGVSGMADHDIFQGKQFQSAPTSSNMQAPSIKQKGTPMSLGNNLINSTLSVMERNIMKASVCERCGKKGCVNKMHCMAKADDGKKKKPAHGMVIVIGSKAGPGPSTNGKRDDKKDDKE
jgi:hypothetical protein|tara:strand:+ start:8348 stop:9472 length:1125 start_codon:yes stop_codon:yes gene_type:complete